MAFVPLLAAQIFVSSSHQLVAARQYDWWVGTATCRACRMSNMQSRQTWWWCALGDALTRLYVRLANSTSWWIFIQGVVSYGNNWQTTNCVASIWHCQAQHFCASCTCRARALCFAGSAASWASRLDACEIRPCSSTSSAFCVACSCCLVSCKSTSTHLRFSLQSWLQYKDRFWPSGSARAMTNLRIYR